MSSRGLVFVLALLAAGCGSRSGLFDPIAESATGGSSGTVAQGGSGGTIATGGSGGSGGSGGTIVTGGSGGTGGVEPTCFDLGAGCSEDDECCSGFCNLGTCAVPPVACEPGAPVVDLAVTQVSVQAVALDGLNVYFALDSGEVYRVPKAGGALALLGSVSGGARNISLKGAYVYTAGSGGIQRLHKQQGGVEVIADGAGHPWDVSADGSQAYYSRYFGGTIERTPLKGGVPEILVLGLSRPFEVEVRDDYVYFGENGSGTVKRVPKKGGSVETLEPVTSSVWGLGVDDVSVFWTEACGPTCGRIRGVPKTGGPSFVLAEGLDSPLGLALDAARVYWINYSTSATPNASISAISKGGGPNIAILAGGFTGGSHLAVDDACVYWGQNDGRVRRAAKPL